MKRYLVAYFIALIVMVLIDAVWLSTMADRLYRPVMGDMLAPQFTLVPALVFYLIYPAGLVFLAVRPALRQGGLSAAILSGAVLGFTAYGTYDLTNQATLIRWSTALTLADLCWGTFLSAIASGAGYWITARLFGGPTSGGHRL
ncbi:membrane protein [Rhizobium wenxiniae]|uniref:Putative membrane protein n=1 Tax=Rhizobium wenxiniae TaxID=1737357 RepID=A0A7X0D1Q4_9HYPH|nr:DUF2177 family protein [Rhizobium wenxiniae]MBB6164800.1 putative membrane protein [Rhizobium wenxiniae]GGG05711.1 membrane protein [Rhizobium wenxiniae]